MAFENDTQDTISKNEDDNKDTVVEDILEKLKKQRIKRRRLTIASIVAIFALILVKALTSGVIHIKWLEDHQNKKREIAITEAKDIYDLLPYIENGKKKSKEYLSKKYANEIIRIDDKVGYIDEQLNVKIPVIYDEIEIARVNNLGEEKEELFYKIKGSEGIGLLDSETNVVFEPKYMQIEVIENDRYLVGKIDDATDETILKIVNNNKEIICESNIGDGYCDGCYVFGDDHVIKIRCREGKDIYTGILNMNLEPVIPAKYDDIKLCVYQFRSAYEYYEVIKDNQYANFDINGNQTGFFSDIEE